LYLSGLLLRGGKGEEEKEEVKRRRGGEGKGKGIGQWKGGESRHPRLLPDVSKTPYRGFTPGSHWGLPYLDPLPI